MHSLQNTLSNLASGRLGFRSERVGLTLGSGLGQKLRMHDFEIVNGERR